MENQEKTNSSIENGWVICGKCGKKLFKVVDGDYNIHGAEFKCPRCKSIVEIEEKSS